MLSFDTNLGPEHYFTINCMLSNLLEWTDLDKVAIVLV